MTQNQPSAWGASSSDAELIAAVRNGATAAFGVLYERHAGAAGTVARQYLTPAAGAEDVVADAFAKVLTILRSGRGPDTAFRAYLFTVVRRLAYVAVNQSRRVQATDDAGFESVFGPSASSEEPALEGFERSTVAKAYKALPERWQAALWYSEVEGLTPAQFAPSLGLTANGAAALAYRAREGLRQQYLQQHLAAPPEPGCSKTNPLLAGYVRDGLSRRDTVAVEAHLETCAECRGLLVELGDVSHGMRAIIAPLVLGTVGLGAIGGGLPVWGAATGAAAVGGAGVGAGAVSGSTASTATTTSGAQGAASSVGGGAGSGSGGAASASGAASAAGSTAVGTTTSALGGAGVIGTAGMVAVGAVALPAVAAAAAAATETTPAAAASATGSTSAGAASASAAAAGATSAAGAATAAGASGLGAVLAGIPALVIGAAAVVVVGAGVAISAALGVFSDAPHAPPPDAASEPSADDSEADPQPSGNPAADPADPTNTLVPDPSPAQTSQGPGPDTPSPPTRPRAPATPATPAPGAAAAQPTVPSSAQTAPPQGPTTDPTDPTTDPTAAPTDPEPSPEPTTGPTTPPATPAALQVSFKDGTRLVARQDNTVALVVANTGGTAATDVAVSLTVPDTLRFIPESTTSGVFGPRVARTAADGWTCTAAGAGGDTQVVRCVVDEIAPGAEVTLALTFHAADAVTADLAAQVFVGQSPVGAPWPFTSPVDAAPARLTSSLVPVAALVAGQRGHVALTVANRGQLTASDPRLAVELPQGSGLSWPTDPRGALLLAPGSTPGWSCAVAQDALTCAGPQINGDQSATVIVPVAVAADSDFAGEIVSRTTSAGASVPDPEGTASTVSVASGGLSAASLLGGQLQVAHVAGPLDAPLHLTLPDAVRVPAGATVREAVLVWSGQDAQGLDAQDLSDVELRTDAGSFAREHVEGDVVVLPAGADGTSRYWGSADVTALVSEHAQTGRWFLAPQEGSLLPADLTWSLTVVYEEATLPYATVSLLLGPPAVDGLSTEPGAEAEVEAGSDEVEAPSATVASPPLALPAWGGVRVAVTGTAHGTGDLAVNDTTLPPLAGDLPDVMTYRSDGLLAAPQGQYGPLALSLDPGTNDFSVLAVHSSTVWEAPAPELSGVLDQPQAAPAELVVRVDVAASVEIGDGAEVPVTVHNESTMDLADVVATFLLPAGVTATAPPELDCTTASSGDASAPSGDVLTCAVGPVEAGQQAIVPLTLTATEGVVLSEEIIYTVTGADPVTGASVQAEGTFVVTAQPVRGVRGTWHGPVAVTEVGAPLMRCTDFACWLASGSWWNDATNDHLGMRPLNDAGGVTSSSSSTLTIPAGATVKHAGLYWSANRTARETFTHDLTSARLRAPGSTSYLPVDGEVLGEVSDSAGRVSYQSYADVTDLVAAHGSGEWSVADVALADLDYGSGWGEYLASRDHYAGWALVVVYEDASLPDGTVTVHDTPVAVTPGAGLSVDFLGGETTTLGAVAWEGDRGIAGDELRLNSNALRPLMSGSTPDRPRFGSASDAFASTAWGSTSRYENSLGVDAKKFETVATQHGVNTVTATTTGDEYVLGVLTITTR